MNEEKDIIDVESEEIKETENKKEVTAAEEIETVKEEKPEEEAVTEAVNTEEIKTAESEAEEVKIEEAVHSAASETKTEEKKKASFNASAQETEMKDHHYEPRKKSFPWKPIVKYACIIAAVGAASFGGSYFGAKTANDQAAAESANTQQSQFPNGGEFSFSGGGMKGGFSDDNSDNSNEAPSDNQTPDIFENGRDENTNSAGLGIYIAQTDAGLVIQGFTEGSKAEEAGLAEGDLLVKVDGKEYGFTDLVTYIGTKKAGDKVSVTVERDGKEIDAEVELIDRTAVSESNAQTQSFFPSESGESYKS